MTEGNKFLSVDFADAVGAKLAAHIEQERTGAAGKVEDAIEMFFLSGARVLAA